MAEPTETQAVSKAVADPSLVLLTVEEVARRLRTGRTTCFKLVLAGEIESVTVGRLRRVPPEAFVSR
ncbi:MULTISPECIES: excisionase family DNA-binding protein [Streptomyces]|uniref:excisionase family DNA-binding protein n=1 Tax=Streptomyces TaxID=1883 RepID=UPI002E2E1DE9|nr:excisionase family DNA-binding protein [Streptomyces sp. NBC_00271]